MYTSSETLCVVDIGLKTVGVMGLVLKTLGSWVLKIQQTEAHSTGLMVSSSKIFISLYTNPSISEKLPFLQSVLTSFIVHYRI